MPGYASVFTSCCPDSEFCFERGGGGTLSSVCSGREGGREGGEKTGRAVSSLSPKDSLRIGPISRRKND